MSLCSFHVDELHAGRCLEYDVEILSLSSNPRISTMNECIWCNLRGPTLHVFTCAQIFCARYVRIVKSWRLVVLRVLQLELVMWCVINLPRRCRCCCSVIAPAAVHRGARLTRAAYRRCCYYASALSPLLFSSDVRAWEISQTFSICAVYLFWSYHIPYTLL